MEDVAPSDPHALRARECVERAHLSSRSSLPPLRRTRAHACTHAWLTIPRERREKHNNNASCRIYPKRRSSSFPKRSLVCGEKRRVGENIRGRVCLETTGMSVLSRRNPASAIDREETERRELRVTLRAERIHRGGSGRVREGLLEKRNCTSTRRWRFRAVHGGALRKSRVCFGPS